MKYKAIALDMDGTLLNAKHKLTPETRDVLIQAQEAGVKVILASGRPNFGMMEVAKELRLEDYCGIISSFNGGKLIDTKTNEVIYENSLTAEDCHDIYDFSKECKIGLIAYDGDEIITEDYDEYIDFEFTACKKPAVKTPNFKKAITGPSTKCLVTGKPEHIIEVEKKFQAKFGDRFSMLRSMPFFLEITRKNVNKGATLEKVAESLNIDMTEIIACGDGHNDFEMIRRAGLGVAMANAGDDIKQVADYITTSNNEEGVAKVVKKFILNS